MKYLNYLIGSLIFLLLFIGYFHPINAITQDLGRHFLLGDIILKTHNVPDTNLFSYTYPNFPFVNLHWLSEVVFYLIFKFIGFNGLLIFSTAIILISFSIVFFYSFKKEKIIPLSIISVFYIPVLFERTDIRPEIFSFLFLAIFVAVLYKFKFEKTKLIFILPFIELLWVNMHIYFIIGIAVLGIFLLDSIIQSYKNKDKKFLSLLFITVFSTLATFINPNFITGAIYPLRVFENYGYSIEENQNIFFLWNLFQKQTILYFVISAFTLIIVLFINIKKSKKIDWLLSLFFIALSIMQIRNFPLFVFGTFIPFAKNLSDIYTRLPTIVKKTIPYLLLLLIIWQGNQVVKDKGFGFGVEKGAEKGVDFFIKNKLKGPIFNGFDVGGYLDYRLYPDEKVFVDNRPGEYPASFFQNVYIPMQNDQKIFDEIDKKYNFNVIFFNHTDQTPWAENFLKQIIRNKNWELIYLDDYCLIFVKNNKNNAELINKYRMPERKNLSNVDYKNKNSLIGLSVFFNKTGLLENEVEIHNKILGLDPNFCYSLYRMANLLSQKNSSSADIYGLKFRNLCR